MSDNFSDESNQNEEESFADLFESYGDSMVEDLRVGDKVSGEIISIGMDNVFLNTGAKIDGAVDKAELLNEDGELPYAVGDTLELYVVSLDENEIRLSRALSGVGGLNQLREAFQAKVPVEGNVAEQVKGGFRVEVMQHRAFCPVSQIDTRYVEHPEDYVGQTHRFLITRFEENGRNIVVSRRELLAKEQEKAKGEFLETAEAGMVTEGRVTSLMPYGAFVELFPGVEGLVHVSELSWSRVDKPEEVVRVDDHVQVKVLSIETGKKPGEVKVSLSMKQLSGDPWDTKAEAFKAGEKVQGKVTRLMDFGAFVEIAPGIEGLVHISEMSYTRRVLKPDEEVKEGETVDVTIKDVDLENRRISLSIRDAAGDPWIGIKDKYPVGTRMEGTLEKKERFGYFITLEPGITGLMPRSRISKSAAASALDKLKVGDPISILVEEIHPSDRKITLAPGDAGEEGDWRDYAKGKEKSLGSLGEKLQQAMKDAGK
ncbi:MAG: 30S ribosomal protein S1 [Thermodesulfobacteriota bacterium]